MFKKIAVVVTIAIAITTGVAAFAYDLGPADYIITDFDEAAPVIVTTFTITPATSIATDDLALLDLIFSSNQMLAWQATLSEAPVTSWTKVASLQYHAFDKDGSPKADRKLVTTTKWIILHLFFKLGE